MVYFLNFFVEIIMGIFLLIAVPTGNVSIHNNIYERQKKLYCIICGTLWILISGLRSTAVGADTLSYKISFENVKSYNIEYLLKNVTNKYISGVSIKDPGYDLFVKIFQYISGNYQIYLMFIAILFMVLFTVWIIRESKDPLVSFALYSSLFYSFFSITGIRQTIATAMVVLIGDKLIKNKKLIPFVIIVLLASTIHASALVFLPFYFLSRIPVNIKTISAWIIGIVISFLARRQLKAFFIDISGYDGYTKDYEGAGTPIFSLLMFLILIWVLVSFSGDKEKDENRRFYNALFLALFFTPLTWLNPSAMRIVQYFSIYLILLIPHMVEVTFDKKSQKPASGIIVTILLLLLLKGNPQYAFFWQ